MELTWSDGLRCLCDAQQTWCLLSLAERYFHTFSESNLTATYKWKSDQFLSFYARCVPLKQCHQQEALEKDLQSYILLAVSPKYGHLFLTSVPTMTFWKVIVRLKSQKMYSNIVYVTDYCTFTILSELIYLDISPDLFALFWEQRNSSLVYRPSLSEFRTYF